MAVQSSSTPAASKIDKLLKLRSLWIQTSFRSWYTAGSLICLSTLQSLVGKELTATGVRSNPATSLRSEAAAREASLSTRHCPWRLWGLTGGEKTK